MAFNSRVAALLCKIHGNEHDVVWYNYPLAVCDEGDDDDDGGYDYAPAA